MIQKIKNKIYNFLRWSERYTKTDMVYLAKSGLWLNLGAITISALSLILYIVFARSLPKEVYGTYQYLLSAGAIIGSITLTGMNSAVARAVAQKYEGTFKESMSVQFKWNLVPIIVSTVISTYYFLNENFVLGSGFLLIGIFVPLNNTLNTYGAFLQGKKDFRANYLYGLGWNLPFYAVMIFASFFFKIALVLLFANLISQAIGLFIVYKRTLRVYKPDTLVDRSAISYGKHLSAMGWFGAIVTQIDMVFAFHYLGAVDLAIYSFATAIPERLSSLLKFLPSAALPKLSEKSPDEVRSALGKRVWIVIFGAAVLTVVYIVFAPFIFHYLFPTYEAAIKYSQIYAFMIIASISGLFSTALTAQGNIRGLYFFNIGSSVIQLIIQLVGAAFFGLIGLVFAKLASSFISFALSIILLYSKKQHITTPS